MRKEINFNIIPNDNNLNEYKTDSFILPLKGFSVGFDKYFEIEEINKYSTIYNISVIINKFLHSEDLKELKKIIKGFKNVKNFYIEDFAISNLIDKEKIVLFPNHIISNYYGINYLKSLSFKNVVISNELTIDELKEIKNNTTSNIFYFYLNKNNIMYSKRELLTNYYDNYNIKNRKNKLNVKEEVSNHDLLIYEEEKSTSVFNNKIFCASKYLSDLKSFNLIINFNNIDSDTKKLILNNLNNKELYKLIDSDFKFLEDKIMYKVGDIK